MDLSKRLRGFLEQRLTTLDQIDVALLLRNDPSRFWTAPEVSAELRIPPEPAAMRLFLLASSGLIMLEASGIPKYRYAGLDSETESILQELSEAMKTNRSAIASMVGGQSRDPIRTLADAFKLK